ncbi:putative cleavage and polyadenylation specificity factor subunit 1 [Porphyridium purpureum]|uniref:Putative cleavage and polyadenylation specificity factor subunit 1 n=1 Tax=Porphyridium purpureum TaxID=35688 RepID=A0A5J4YZB3_PORPP|nr:putative cleavage and polyadenylation specificity factor subunit 1 [Porphyridium purpureum]|eukprot:POR6549..scf209_3
MAFAAVNAVHPPTGVTHALSARILRPDGGDEYGGDADAHKQLVLVKGTLLELYVVREQGDARRLQLIHAQHLLGVVESAVAVPLPYVQYDCVVLGFRGARISVLSWDPTRFEWRTEQIFSLAKYLTTAAKEGDPDPQGVLAGRDLTTDAPLLKAERSGRSLAVLCPNTNVLFVLPIGSLEFYMRTVIKNQQPEYAGNVLITEEKILCVPLIDYGVWNVRDFCYCEDAMDPTLAMVFAPHPTWAGRVAANPAPCKSKALRVDLHTKYVDLVWTLEALPFDVQLITGIPRELGGGGCLIQAPSVLFLVRYGIAKSVLAVNEVGLDYFDYVRSEVKEHRGMLANAHKAAPLALDLSSCLVVLQVDKLSAWFGSALILLPSGRCLQMKIPLESETSPVLELGEVRTETISECSALTMLDHELVFVGSRWSDSLVFKMKRREQPNEPRTYAEGHEPAANGILSDLEGDRAEFPSKSAHALKVEPNAMEPGTGAEREGKGHEDEDASWIFQTEPSMKRLKTNAAAAPGQIARFESTREGSAYELVECDRLQSLGPNADVSAVQSTDNHLTEDRMGKRLELVVPGGTGASGGLGVLSKTVRPLPLTAFTLANGRCVWTVVNIVRNRACAHVRSQRNAAIRKQNARREQQNKQVQTLRAQFIETALLAQGQQKEEPLRAKAEVKAEGEGQEEKQVGASSRASVKVEEAVLEEPSRKERVKIQADAMLEPRHDAGEADGSRDVKPEQDTDDVVLAAIKQMAEAQYPIQPPLALDEGPEYEDGKHMSSLMFVNTYNPNGTALLRVEEEISKLDEPGAQGGLVTNLLTVAAGNVLGKAAIVQVVKSGVKLLHGTRQAFSYMNPHASSIVHAQVLDPYVLLQLASGTFIVLEARFEGGTSIPVSASSGAVAASSVKEEASAKFDSVELEESEMEMDMDPDDLVSFDWDALIAKTEMEIEAGGQVSSMTLVEVYYSGDTSGGKVNELVQSVGLYRGPAAQAVFHGSADAGTPGADWDGYGNGDDGELYDVMGSRHGNGSDLPSSNMMTEEDFAYQQEEKSLYGYVPNARSEARAFSASDPLVVQGGDDKSSDGEHGILLVVLSRSGVLEVRSAPDFDITIFRNARFFLLPQILDDDGGERQMNAFSVVPDSEDDNRAPGSAAHQSSAPLSAVPEKSKAPSAAVVPSAMQITSVALASVRGVSSFRSISTLVLIALDQQNFPTIYRGHIVPVRDRRRTRLNLEVDDLAFRWRVRFVRVLGSEILLHQVPSPEQVAAGAAASAAASTSKKAREMIEPSVVAFDDIAGRGGIFVKALHPFLLFAERGYFRYHPVSVPGQSTSTQVGGFAPVHAVNCRHGFVMLTNVRKNAGGQGDAAGAGSEMGHDIAAATTLSICVLPPPDMVSYEGAWSMRKVPCHGTPLRVTYHPQTEAVCALVLCKNAIDRVQRANEIRTMSSFFRKAAEDDDEDAATRAKSQGRAKEAEQEGGAESNASSGLFMPDLESDVYEVHSYRPDRWELIDKHKLQPYEVALSAKCMTVDVYKSAISEGASAPSSNQGRGQGRNSGEPEISPFAAAVKLRPKNMLVVSTGYDKGEEVSIRGRLLMFEISRLDNFVENEVVSTFQMRLISEKELKGPVTDVASMEGYVLVSIGTKVEVYKLVEDEIVCCSFLFVDLFCNGLSSIKNYCLSSDMYRNVTLSMWRNRNKSLNFLAKGYEPLDIASAEFLVHDAALGVVVADANGNVQLMHYDPEDPDARGGSRLVPNGALFMGTVVNRMLRVRDHMPKVIDQTHAAGKQDLVYVSSDGEIGSFAPLNEVEFRALSTLSSRLAQSTSIPRCAGLNPRAFRAFQPPPHTNVQVHQHNLIDVDFIADLAMLDRTKRSELLRLCGVKEDALRAALYSLARVWARF